MKIWTPVGKIVSPIDRLNFLQNFSSALSKGRSHCSTHQKFRIGRLGEYRRGRITDGPVCSEIIPNSSSKKGFSQTDAFGESRTDMIVLPGRRCLRPRRKSTANNILIPITISLKRICRLILRDRGRRYCNQAGGPNSSEDSAQTLQRRPPPHHSHDE